MTGINARGRTDDEFAKKNVMTASSTRAHCTFSKGVHTVSRRTACTDGIKRTSVAAAAITDCLCVKLDVDADALIEVQVSLFS